MVRLDISSKLLYDGDERYQPDIYTLAVGNTSISLPWKSILYFAELENVIGTDQFIKVISEHNIEKFTWESLISYRINNRHVYYVIKENHLILVTYSEENPGRYILRLIGIWDLSRSL
jgi:hypothetical protein